MYGFSTAMYGFSTAMYGFSTAMYGFSTAIHGFSTGVMIHFIYNIVASNGFSRRGDKGDAPRIMRNF
jgi:hypothetical protein